MFANLASLRNRVKDRIEERGDDDLIDRYIRYAVEYIEAKGRWDALQQNETITPDSNGIIAEPPLCRVINEVYPYTTAIVKETKFEARTRPYTEVEGNRILRKYYLPAGFKTGLGETYSVDVTQGSTTVSQNSGEASWFDADDVGNLVMFSGSNYFYKITAVDTDDNEITITPKYADDNETNATAINQPSAQRQYKLIEPSTTDSGDSVYTDDVDVYYQRIHPPMTDNSDLLLIPAKRSVELAAAIFALQAAKYDVDAQRLDPLLREALQDDMAQIPKRVQSTLPNGLTGGASMFQVKTRNNFGLRRNINNTNRRLD